MHAWSAESCVVQWLVSHGAPAWQAASAANCAQQPAAIAGVSRSCTHWFVQSAVGGAQPIDFALSQLRMQSAVAVVHMADAAPVSIPPSPVATEPPPHATSPRHAHARIWR